MGLIILGGAVSTPAFDPRLHRYTVDGKEVPSVSSILRILTDAVYGPIPKETLAAAAAFGTAVHACTEYLDEGDLDRSSVSEDWVPYLDAYEAWKQDMGPTIEAIELRLGCPRFAGTLDRIVRFNADPSEVLWVIDLKTTSVLHPHVGVQLAAYVALASLMYPGHKWRRAAVQLKGDGTYAFREFKDLSDETCFNALLGIYYWGKKHGQDL